MRSRTTRQFRDLLQAAPPAVRDKAHAAFLMRTANPDHPSLRFKKVHATLPVYSVRIDLDWRAVGVLQEGLVVWFWVGPHREYDRLLTKI